MSGVAAQRRATARRPPVTVHLLRCLVLAGTLHAAACGEPDDPLPFLEETGLIRPVALLGEGPVSAPARPVEFFRPLDLAVVGDSVYVVDNGNDQVVVLDRDLRVLGVLGREGEGPGEYQRPVAVRASPGGAMVVDMGNNRFTELDRAGIVVRTFAAPPALLSFAVTSAGSVLVPSRDGTHHFAKIRDGEREEFGQWPQSDSAALDDEESWSIGAGFHDPSIALTTGDTAHLFDEREAVLYKYAPGGELLLRRALPRTLRDSAAARTAALVGGLVKQGLRVLSSRMSRGLSATPDGMLLLQLPVGETLGVVIDPATYAAKRLAGPVDPTLRSYFQGARAMTIADSVLYVVKDVSIRTFRLSLAE